MQQTIAGPLAESGVLDVLADDPRALLVAAAEEIAAVVTVHWGAALDLIIILVRHGNFLSPERGCTCIPSRQ
jgi:hypothetical protein